MGRIKKIEKIHWDSNFFGYPVGKISFPDQEKDLNKILIDSSRFKLTYLFSKEEINANDERIKYVDTKVVWKKLIDKDSCGEKYEVFNNLTHSYKELLYLVYLSGTYSRFKLDNNFQNNEFERLYKIWIDKSIISEYDKIVIIKTNNNNLEGFITLKEYNDDTAIIGLISVHPQSQGKGIATCLIQMAANYAYDKNFKTLEVATQSVNEPAMRLYEKNGFNIKSKVYIYHIWNR